MTRRLRAGLALRPIVAGSIAVALASASAVAPT
jgi:hypothetical protein